VCEKTSKTAFLPKKNHFKRSDGRLRVDDFRPWSATEQGRRTRVS